MGLGEEELLVLLVPLALASGFGSILCMGNLPAHQAWGRTGEGWRYFFTSACPGSILTQGKGSVV